MKFFNELSFLVGVALLAPSSALGADKKKEEAPAELAVPVATIGEQQCEADIFYSWEPAFPGGLGTPLPAGSPSADGTSTTLGAANGAPAGDTAAPTPITIAAPIEEHFSKALSSAATETDAKERLEAEIAAQRRLAGAECSRRHENLGECMASHISVLGSEFGKLDFETRRLLREQFKTDCERLEGRCKGTKAGEAKCRAVLGETPPPVAVAGEQPGEKAPEKGKGKK